jgi:DNA (cytosine-5)-methyltransferase 1
MTAYYNEIDEKAAAWLRELIRRDLIASGDVDTRSIEDVSPDDLRPYTQCHFFAGIGVWSYSLRLAGWPDDRPVWTGSCPCQPFSAAGKGGGFADERHLWPAMFHLIRERRPVVWLGEQVASKDGLAWFDLVQADLEGEGYAVGAVDTCSAGFGAPHIRQRLRVAAQRVADADDARPQGRIVGWDSTGERAAGAGGVELQGQPSPVNGFWRSADWLFCRDGKWRPVSPKPQPLVDGSAESLGRVCPDDVKEIEEELNAWSMEGKIDCVTALRDAQSFLAAKARREWPVGGLPGLHAPPFLLAFLRQLTEQGWCFSERLSAPRTETFEDELRVLWYEQRLASASREHGLDGQQPGERTNPLHFLPSLLARFAHKAWSHAYSTYAEIGFPLAHGARARVARLRGYGNAVDAIATKEFIEAADEAFDDLRLMSDLTTDEGIFG